ncbi:hypothetical protein [Paenibacillus cisolokensis]|nr:hypothetical protein [Paenibacillus cisolokensis]
MYDLYEFIKAHWGKPITWTTIVALTFMIIDKAGRRLITHQMKRLFHVRDKSEFRQFTENQARIEAEILAIAEHLGVNLSNVQKSSSTAQTSSKQLSSGFWKGITGKKYLRRISMERINKTILVPLLAAIATFIKQVFGVEIPDEHIDMIANVILFILMVIGIFIAPKKKEQEKEKPSDAEAYYH